MKKIYKILIITLLVFLLLHKNIFAMMEMPTSYLHTTTVTTTENKIRRKINNGFKNLRENVIGYRKVPIVIEEVEEEIEKEVVIIDNKIDLTEKELEILTRITEAEGTGEGLYGKELIVQIIINRVESEFFQDSIEGVVFSRLSSGYYEFSPIHDGRYKSVKITEETIEAVNNVLNNGSITEPTVNRVIDSMGKNITSEDFKSVLFFQMKNHDGWMNRNRKLIFTYKNHNFYE